MTAPLVEYDEPTRTLILTDRLGPDEYGASTIVARDVYPPFGRRVERHFSDPLDVIAWDWEPDPEPGRSVVAALAILAALAVIVGGLVWWLR